MIFFLIGELKMSYLEIFQNDCVLNQIPCFREN